MAGKSKSGTILAVIVMIIVLVLVAGVVSWLVKDIGNGVIDDLDDWVSDITSPLKLTIDDIEFDRDISDFYLYDGDKIGVSTSEYDIKVTGARNDKFSVNVYGNKYEWSNFYGTDFTDCFTYERNKTGFILCFDDFPTVVAKIMDCSPDAIDYVDADADIFTMAISKGSKTIKISFNITYGAGWPPKNKS